MVEGNRAVFFLGFERSVRRPRGCTRYAWFVRRLRAKVSSLLF